MYEHACYRVLVPLLPDTDAAGSVCPNVQTRPGQDELGSADGTSDNESGNLLLEAIPESKIRLVLSTFRSEGVNARCSAYRKATS